MTPTPARFSDAHLEPFRSRADPAADQTVADIYAEGRSQRVNGLLRTLLRNDGIPSHRADPRLRRYLDETSRLPSWADARRIRHGQRVFMRHAPAIALVLPCASLPTTFLAAKGVQVVHRTQRLGTDAARRIIETAQFIFDVMEPGGLEGSGRGIRSIQKVRLLHAAIRHLLSTDPDADAWDADLGHAINQEDMAGTLMSFSITVADALPKLGIDLSEREIEDYLHLWRVIGFLSGIEEDLLPETAADARALVAAIERRHFRPTPEGVELCTEVVEAIEKAIPGRLMDGLGATLMRRLIGDERADQLEIPPADFTRVLVDAGSAVAGIVDELADASALARASGEWLGELFLEGLVTLATSGDRVTFRLPRSLRDRIRVPDGSLAGRIGRFLPLIITRRVATNAPYPWYPFATHYDDPDGVVGAHHFEDLARERGMEFAGRGTDTGLMEDFDGLRSPSFDPDAVSPLIHEFYEHTTRFSLEATVTWSKLFTPALHLWNRVVGRRMKTLNVPRGRVEDLENWIELLDDDGDGDPEIRAWIRVFDPDEKPLYVGAYKIYESQRDGDLRTYISVAFPVALGNITTVLTPENFEGDGLRLTTVDRSSSEAGLYHVLPGRETFHMWPAYGLREEFLLRPKEDGKGLRVTHNNRVLFAHAFTIQYDSTQLSAAEEGH